MTTDGNNSYDMLAPGEKRPAATSIGAGARPAPGTATHVPGGVCGRGVASGGRACKHAAVAGSKFCTGHTCETAGCFETKSAAATGCSTHILPTSTSI